MIPGVILPQHGVKLGQEKEAARDQRRVSSKKQHVNSRGKEKGSLASRQRR